MDFNHYALSVIDSIPIRDKTRKNYRSVFKCHIEMQFENKKFDALTRHDIQNAIVSLPPQTAAMTLAVIKTVFREGQAAGIIDYSPAQGVRALSPVVAPRRFLTWDEVKAADFGKYTPQIRFLALHGLRWGEAVALKQEDIHDGRVYINRSIHGATKSQSGTRVVPLVSEFKPFPKSPKTLRKVLAPYGVHIHSLRHTYAYLLKTQGVHVTTAQRLLGHSDPKVTLKVYTQVLDDEIDSAGNILRLISKSAYSRDSRIS